MGATANSHRSTVVIAHRGLSARFRENSIEAIGEALLHSPVVEVDVRVTRDGVPVCMHDATLERTDGFPFRVSQLSHRRLLVLAPHVADLATVLELVAAAGGAAMLDVKATRSRALEAVREVVAASSMRWSVADRIRQGRPLAPGTLSFQSRRLAVLQQHHRLTAAECLLHVTRERDLRRLMGPVTGLPVGVAALTIPDRFVHPETLPAMQVAGVATYVYTVNDVVRFEQLRAAGAHGVYTDVVDVMTSDARLVA